MSEERAKQLALIYQGIEDCDREFSEFRTDYKARREALEKQAYYLRRDILSGQMTLVDPPPENRITEADELRPAGD
jgi:hypothetical protein